MPDTHPLHPAHPPEQDPIRWSIALTLAFAALVFWHLGIPSKIYFDEVHYVPAARRLLALLPANPEHPLVGKEAIAAAIALLGDHPLVWRLPSAIMGTLGFFAFSRALWFASGRRFATLAGGVLLLTDFSWFVESRIAMLDMVMSGFGMIALWQVAAVARLSGRLSGTEKLAITRARLALAGICLGLAMGAKWSILPVWALLGVGFVVLRVRASGKHCLEATDAAPIRGITLIEGLFWLGTLPFLTYWLSFLPFLFYHQSALRPLDIIAWQREMVKLQASVTRPHPYQSVWWQWMLNWRAIWYLYERVDGGLRGILLVGNPFTMLAGLPAWGWCLWVGLRRQRGEALALALLYAFSLGLWAVNGKPVQFYYHYLLPAAFLMGCLALALDALWRHPGRWRWAGPDTLATGALWLAVGLFAGFFPIISAMQLGNNWNSFEAWMWLRGWR